MPGQRPPHVTITAFVSEVDHPAGSGDFDGQRRLEVPRMRGKMKEIVVIDDAPVVGGKIADGYRRGNGGPPQGWYFKIQVVGLHPYPSFLHGPDRKRHSKLDTANGKEIFFMVAVDYENRPLKNGFATAQKSFSHLNS